MTQHALTRHAEGAPGIAGMSGAISVETLNQLLICDAVAGKLLWQERGLEWFEDGGDSAVHNAAKWNGRFAGKEAICSGSASHGYLDGAILGVGVLAHRVIFAMHYGYWPVGIDHADGNRRNNRIENLVEADQATNMRNLRIRSDNKSGVSGVWQLKGSGRWRARIKADGKDENLGAFDTKQEAIAARNAAKARFGYHKNHGRLS